MNLMTTSTAPFLAVLDAGHEAGTLTAIVYHALHAIALSIGIIGVAILVWGVLTGVLLFIKSEVMAIHSEVQEEDRERLRNHLGYYLLLGLEVLIAADIVESIAAPSMDALLLLGGVVIIRTVISVSLNWELSKDKRSHMALLSKPPRPNADPTHTPPEPGDG